MRSVVVLRKFPTGHPELVSGSRKSSFSLELDAEPSMAIFLPFDLLLVYQALIIQQEDQKTLSEDFWGFPLNQDSRALSLLLQSIPLCPDLFAKFDSRR
jgi:hypothetical protein